MANPNLAAIRESARNAHLGYLDALLEKKESILALSLEELVKLSTLGRAADNNCCNGSTGLAAKGELSN
jgi:hypothetical protein